MARLILYIAQSLDGFIAASDGSIEWLQDYQQPGEDYGFSEFLQSTGALIMGSVTYRQLVSGCKTDPHKGLPTFVHSRSNLPGMRGGDLRVRRGTPQEVLSEARSRCAPGLDVWLCGGAKTIVAYLAHGLVDEMRIFTAPVMLGSGIRLFTETEDIVQPLELLACRSFANGMLEQHYRIAN